MREIKFRGKAKMSIEELDDLYLEHENGWVYGHLVMYGKTPYIVGDFIEVDSEYTVNEFWVPVYPESVGQFTGLTDKNGKEIYEGDILLLHQFLFDGHEFENELIGEVIYDQETCSFALRNIRNADVKKYMGYKEHEDCGNIPIFNFYGLHEESFEKLGDIYENPELLEEGFK
ncbi:YopX family protein [Caldifermentibacillus hisashii]|uniref:YopX family protein n=1 Tax=Caldifermentibacillus hisashii TaxID=996558 RepID=A0ABU9K564_9BACI